MIQETEHIIGVQQFEITSDDEKKAHDFQSTISILQESRITTLFQKVFNQYSSPDSIYRFKQIELNLGSISQHNFDNELLFRLEEALIQFFKSNIQSDGNLRTGEKIVLQNQKLEQLEHFLINGFLKWNYTSGTTPQKILHELITESPEELTELLNKLGKKQEIRKRMILQFPEESLEKVVQHVAKTEGEYIISYKQNMLDHHRKTKFIDTAFSTFRNAVWEVILSYLFESSNSYYNKKNFLQFLIQKIALKYNLTYQILLEVISTGVEFEDETSQIPEFKKLIIELTNEEISNGSVTRTKKVKTAPIADIIQELELFLSNTTKSYSSHILSKKDFETKIKTLFQNPNQITRCHLTKWLKNQTYRKQLFYLLNQKSISILIELGAKDFSLKIRDFLNEIEQQQLSSQSKSFLQTIIQHKSKLIFLAISESNHEQVLLKFLYTLKKEIDFIDETLVTLLNEVKKNLSTSYQKIIQTFLNQNPKLLTKYRIKSKQEQNVIQITNQLQQFISSNPIHLWHEWFHNQIPLWIKQSKFSNLELLQQIKLKLEYRFASPEIISFISNEEHVLHSPSTISRSRKGQQKPLIHPQILKLIYEEIDQIEPIPFSNWSRAIIRLFQKVAAQYQIPFSKLFKAILLDIKKCSTTNSTTNKYRLLQQLSTSSEYLNLIETIEHQEITVQYKNNISYILHQEKWPWWDSNYRKDQFNQEFKALWGIYSEQKKLLKIIKSKSNQQHILKFFDAQNTYSIWKKLDVSVQKSYAQLCIDLHVLLLQGFIPISSISHSNIDSFNLLVYNFLSQSTTAKKNIVSFFQSWLNSTFIIHNKSTRNLWIDILHRISKKSSTEIKNQIFSWIENLHESALNFNTNNNDIIQLFLTNYNPKITDLKTPRLIVSELERISLQKPNVFNQWIQQIEFRDCLIQQLSETEIIHIIQLKLNSRQQQYLNDSLQITNKFLINFSSTESIRFRHVLFNQVFSEISRHKISTWTLQEWSKMIVHLIIKLLNPQKVILLLNQKSIKSQSNLNVLLIQNVSDRLESHSNNKDFLSSNDINAPNVFLKQLKTSKQTQSQTTLTPLLSQLFKNHILWLSETKFRNQVIEIAFEKNLQLSIEQTLTPPQKTYFKTALSFISRLDVSATELKKIKKQFYQLLLLKLSSGGFTSWTFDRWSILLVHVLKNTLGFAKTVSSILTEKEMLMSNSTPPSKTNFEFLELMQNEIQPPQDHTSNEPDESAPNYRKLGEKEQREFLDPIYVNYSGLIILAPYLGMLFERCGLIKNNEFVNTESQSKAVHFLDYAATGSVGKEEHELIVHKVLCGMNIADPITTITDLTTPEKEIIDSLLGAVTQQWSALKNTSIDGLRNSFLEREGKLEEDEDAFHLKIEQKAFDILLDQIPWNITQIKLSWMDKILLAEWR